MNQNILFFSQNCQHSKRVMAKLIDTPVYQSLQKVCVDDPQTRSRLPKWVTCVPLIYLSQSQQGQPSILKDTELWAWVEHQISQSQIQRQPPQQQFQQQNQSMNQRPSQPQSAPSQQMQNGDLIPFNLMEMKSGVASDNYSLLNPDSNEPNMMDGLFMHSYELISGSGNQKQSQQPQPQQSQQQQQNFNRNQAPPAYSPNIPNMSQQGMQQQQMRLNMNGNDPNQSSRSSQKQEKFEQELAMKKAMREQDNFGQPVGKKIDGVPQNFNQMWENNTNNRF
jgi:hypothetical protein